MKGAHRQAHARANGRWAIYWYAWRPRGPQIAAYVGATRAEAEALEEAGWRDLAVEWANATRTTPAKGLVARVVAEYRAHDSYKALKPATRATYTVWLDRIVDEFGALTEREVTDERVSAWLKRVRDTHGARARDHALRILSRVASFGRHIERKLFSATFEPTKGFESLYRAPAQKPWPKAELEKIAGARPAVANILLLALNTGLRRADLCRVDWANVDWDGGAIRLVTSKGERKNRRIRIPLTPSLRATLDAIGIKDSGPILTNARGTAWTSNSMAHAVDQELTKLGIEGRLHGLRRNTATHLASQGRSSREIARVLGWSEADAEAMGVVYIDEGPQ